MSIFVLKYNTTKMKYDLTLKGYVGGWNFDSDYVDYILEKFNDREVSVRIDSTGGQLATALSISAAFKAHGKVNVHFTGMNASAATIASLGAASVSIDAQALYLVHKCSVEVFEYASMNADEIEQKCKELEKQKKALEKIDLMVAAAYASKCRKPIKDLQNLMKEGAWLTAQEAKEWGFVDKITDLDEDAAPVLDSVTANAFKKAGIPLPETAMRDKKRIKNIVDRIFDAIDSKIKSSISERKMEKEIENKTHEAEEVKPEANVGEQTGRPEEQPTAQKEADEDPKDAEIRELKAKLEELQKKPAAAHAAVVEKPKQKRDENDFCNSLESAKKLFNSLP